jgi:hypothetical protein
MMQEQRYIGRLEPGMDVCDLDGIKFGSIERAYRQDMASDQESSSVGTMTREDILQVKTGLLGLGKHYYVPFSAIQDVTSGCVFLNQPKERIDEMGWDVRPDDLDTLT